MLQNYSTFSARPERFSSVKKGLYSSPFGCELKGRNLKLTGVNKSFRFGFQGQEGDDEIKGDGNSYDFGARMLDPRLGRWFVADPLIRKQPSQSPYKAFFNSPMFFTDPDGETEFIFTIVHDEKTGKTVVNLKTANSIMTDGVKHDAGGQACQYQINKYYDYSKITVTTIHADGSQTVKHANSILYENGAKATEAVFFGGDKYGDNKTETWATGEDHGKEVSFGIGMSGGEGEGVGQDWSKNVFGSIDFGDLEAILKRSKISKGYSSMGSWKRMKNAKALAWIEYIKERAEGGSDIVEVAEKGTKVATEITLNIFESAPNMTRTRTEKFETKELLLKAYPEAKENKGTYEVNTKSK